MQYLLMLTVDDDLAARQGPDPDPDASLQAWLERAAAGQRSLHGSRLRPRSDATTVKVRNGEVVVTDGPFAETKEQVAGYDLIESTDLEAAVAWAASHPHARIGAVEVRAVWREQAPEPLPDPESGKRRYVMLVCTTPDVDQDQRREADPVEPWVDEMDRRGTRRFGTPLVEPARARTVRVRDGRVLVTDGPFAETKEQIAGFDILDCDDLDDAIGVARRHPMARGGLLELRPLWTVGES